MADYEPIAISLPPGIVKGQSHQVARDRYVDCNMVRFWKGKPQRWLGWASITDSPLDNPPRGAIQWTALDGTRLMAWGTATKLWLWREGVLFDITPTDVEYIDGFVDTQAATGWDEGGWDEGGWNGSHPIGAENGGRARTWMLAKWGQDLLANPRGGGIFHWEFTTGTPAVAALIPEAPESVLGIFVTDDRHLIALGASIGSTQSPLRIAWANRETLDEWTPDPNNTAGDMLLEQGNEIVGYIPVRAGYLVHTDTSVHTLTLVGGNDVFGIDRKGSSAGLIAPHAAIESDGIASWMGKDSFYVYDGVVRALPCEVHDYIFKNVNRNQAFKICAGTNVKYAEAIWFYPHGDEIENSNYVSINGEGWAIGQLARTSWLDQSAVSKYPVATSPEGVIYRHDVGTLAVDEEIEYFLSTGDLSLKLGPVRAGGENFTKLRTIVPDFEVIEGEHSITITARERPQSTHVMTKGPYPFDETTKRISPRVRGRSFRLHMEGNGYFRGGEMTAYGRPDGSR
jgi:hypothetical protein